MFDQQLGAARLCIEIGPAQPLQLFGHIRAASDRDAHKLRHLSAHLLIELPDLRHARVYGAHSALVLRLVVGAARLQCAAGTREQFSVVSHGSSSG